VSLYFQELATLKKSLEEDAAAHETAIAEMRHKYSQDLAIINEQMEALKKVRQIYVALR
jgi:predicted  nucleic acid-binding Zn-ribbon protein